MTRMLTTVEVGQLTDPPTSRYTVRREIKRGRLAGEPAGGRWYVEPGEARRWAAAYVPYKFQRDRSARVRLAAVTGPAAAE